MAYKTSSTWKTKLDLSGNEVFIEFRKPPRNAQVKQEVAAAQAVTDEQKAELQRKQGEDFLANIKSYVVSISGIEKEDGTEFTPSDLADCTDPQIVNPIVWAYIMSMKSFGSEETNAKKFIGIV